MKVLHITGGLNRGGIENVIFNYAKHIEDDFDFHVLYFDKQAIGMLSEFQDIGVKTHYLPALREVGPLKYVYNLVKFMRLHKFDIVHSHTMQKAGVDNFAAFLSGVKGRVSHSHNTKHEFDKSKSTALKIMRRLIFLFSNKYLACGKEAGIYLYGKKNFLVLKNSINVSRFVYKTPMSHEFSQIFNNVDYKMISVGRLVKQKNHRFLIDLSKELLNHTNSFKILVIGTGVLKDELTEEIHKNDLKDHIELYGSSSEVPVALSSSTHYLMPSLYEGLPLSLVEAQANGINCVVSDKITKESDMGLGNISFLELDVVEWSKHILSSDRKKIDFEVVQNKITDKGYNIVENTRTLSEVYKELVQ